MKNILLAGFMHETNTFSGLATDLEAFRSRDLLYGEEVGAKYRNTKSEIGAVLDFARRHDWVVTSPVFANATPSGKVTRDAFEHVAETLLATVPGPETFDGVLLVLHGAMVCEHVDDGEGDLLARLRERIGGETPVAVTLDLHANVTDRMAELADIICPYRTYPHVDQYETAWQAAGLLERAISGEIKPKTYVARGAMLDGADHGRTTEPGPMRSLLERADAMKRERGVLAAGIAAGFPWADIEEAGPSAVIVGNGDDERFAGLAAELVDDMWRTRRQSTVETLGVTEAMDRVADHAGRIVLADFADNPGGGGYGDATGLLKAMIDAGLENAVYGVLYDPETARTCIDQGLGAHVVAALGGRVDPRFGAPVPVTGNVVAVTDGTFRLKGPMLTGTPMELGPTVVLRVGGLDVVIASRRRQVYDIMYFEHARIDLESKSVIAVKSAHHFRAAFQDMADEILLVDAGGLTSRNYKDLPYENVRRPIYPLDLD